MRICVITTPGIKGEHLPKYFHLGGRRVYVAAILERWSDPRHRYFQVRDTDGRRFVLRHDGDADWWELSAVYGPPRRAGVDARPPAQRHAFFR